MSRGVVRPVRSSEQHCPPRPVGGRIAGCPRPIRRCLMTDMEVVRLNKEVAERIWREVRADPSSPYAGKVVGIANGEVVHVGDDLDTTLRRVREIEPNVWRGVCLEPSRPPEYV